MGQQIADGHLGSSGLSELRPVGGDRLIESDFALVNESEERDGCHRLADGLNANQRVALPGTGAIFVEPAGPEVDD